MIKTIKFRKTLLLLLQISSLVVLAVALSCEVKLVNAETVKTTSIIESKIDNVQEYLKAVNIKLDVINGAIFDEQRLCSDLKPIIAEKFRLIELRLEQLNHKVDELINQNIDNLDEIQKHHLNIDGGETMDEDDFRNRFSPLSSPITKSETTKIVKNHRQRSQRRNITSPSQNNNNFEDQQRQSRDNRKNVNFINELLKMVNDRLISEKEVSSTSSSMTDILSNVENLNNNNESFLSKSVRRRNKTIVDSRGTTANQKSGGIVFPNIKNRLAMMNATSNFMSSIKRETYVCGYDNEEIQFVRYQIWIF